MSLSPDIVHALVSGEHGGPSGPMALAGDCERGVVSFARLAKDSPDRVVCVSNLTPLLHPGHGVGVPPPGYYVERVDADSRLYGGNGGGAGGVQREPIPCHAQRRSVQLALPPVAASWLRPREG